MHNYTEQIFFSGSFFSYTMQIDPSHLVPILTNHPE